MNEDNWHQVFPSFSMVKFSWNVVGWFFPSFHGQEMEAMFQEALNDEASVLRLKEMR